MDLTAILWFNDNQVALFRTQTFLQHSAREDSNVSKKTIKENSSKEEKLFRLIQTEFLPLVQNAVKALISGTNLMVNIIPRAGFVEAIFSPKGKEIISEPQQDVIRNFMLGSLMDRLRSKFSQIFHKYKDLLFMPGPKIKGNKGCSRVSRCYTWVMEFA